MPKISKKQLVKLQTEKTKLNQYIFLVIIAGTMLLVAGNKLWADEIVHKFKSPSFSGVGTSSHYFTAESQEFTRKADIVAEIKALKEQQKRDEKNTTLNRFLANLESRIYSQLSRQLTDALFGETPSTEGSLEFMGTTIVYSVSPDGLSITLTITSADGSVPEITLPIGTFSF